MRFLPKEAAWDPPLLLQNKRMEWVDKYKYLGVTVSTNYVCGYKEELHAKALSHRAFLGSRALWAFSPYKVTRELWQSLL
ncbi:hypothetical protein HPB52_025128 [Rhipicephalus sanguineus]|uniref:Uncharacterized protein n=1 Tax=Rhipicephalus sanguineus TaxID=34632 RepID=A0A9D4TDD9_RHISA|nr:hypothetical protein HPB52_025128 [Rhipicephalus sanguineus]